MTEHKASPRFLQKLRLTPAQCEVLRRVARREPLALAIEDRQLAKVAEQLERERLLGCVEVRGADAYRLTDFGRAALEACDAPEYVADQIPAEAF